MGGASEGADFASVLFSDLIHDEESFGSFYADYAVWFKNTGTGDR